MSTSVQKKTSTAAELRELKARGYDFSPGYLPATVGRLVTEIEALRSEVEDLKVRLLLLERRQEVA